MSVAITKTATSVSTDLLSTKTTCSEPALSDTCMVETDSPVNSNETTAVDNEIINYSHSYSHSVTMVPVSFTGVQHEKYIGNYQTHY